MFSLLLSFIAAIGALQGFQSQPPTDARSDGGVLTWRGTFETGKPACSSSEIAAWSPRAKRLYVCGGPSGILRLDCTDVAKPQLDRQYEIASITSVATHDGLVAACRGGAKQGEVGEVLLLDLDLKLIGRVAVGHGPDMLCFTPDGSRLLVANEGEPVPGGIDPSGSVSIIDLSKGPAHARCTEVNFLGAPFTADALQRRGVVLPHTDRSVDQQLEPEFITVEPSGKRAWVTLQENNAIAAIDLNAGRVLDIFPLGTQAFSAPGGGLDPSDKDGGARIQPWPVEGLLQPDSIGCFSVGDSVFLVTANEGESLAGNTTRVKDLTHRSDRTKVSLDATAFPADAAAGLHDSRRVLASEGLGRLEVCPLLGDDDGDGDYDRLVCFGGRSIALWKVGGSDSAPTIDRVWDSGSALEQELLKALPNAFNADSEESPSVDKRSAKRGPEPEGLTIVEHDGRRLVFVGLERPGGVMAWDISDPAAPSFAGYCNRRDPDAPIARAGDLAPEGLCEIPASSSPTGEPILVVCNEFSGTVSLFAIETKR